MGKFDKMTVRQLAEYIVDQRVKAGYYSPENRDLALKAHLKADKDTLIWNAENLWP